MNQEFAAVNENGLAPVVQALLDTDCKIFLFHGNLGAGKTTLINTICDALGVTESTSSPTFSIVNEYISPSGPVYHFDLYRIKDAGELFDFGFEEYLHSGNFCFIEWPEVAQDFFHGERVNIFMEHDAGGGRRIALQKIL